ncbi:RsfA family transcriptional regulator [Pontibacillus litoralis]|uniref:Transcriptional regulator n=1 Tax=Pontibacillus litoralis JSM 072002 TaxID=1385512 RepID=A0A0A5GCY3_9BACI|nr:RsfA family transcriptional regulator [Pontibacillus litoralis]KGX88980.1 transcriptional regulator [Pontibacillus litoralis JSM 072002]
MVKVRQDAWSHEDDLLLAETVLRHIREGSTQLKAFDEVGDHLNRTSAACGFRWNAEVRQKYIQAIDIAKRQRKEKKRALAGQQTTKPSNPLSPMIFSQEDEEEITWQEPASETIVMEQPTPAKNESVTFAHIMEQLKELQSQYQSANPKKVNELEKENQSLQTEKSQLEQQVRALEQRLHAVQEDYQVLIQVMDRARKMVAFNDGDSDGTKPTFRMEKNGNLEQLAR